MPLAKQAGKLHKTKNAKTTKFWRFFIAHLLFFLLYLFYRDTFTPLYYFCELAQICMRPPFFHSSPQIPISQNFSKNSAGSFNKDEILAHLAFNFRGFAVWKNHRNVLSLKDEGRATSKFKTAFLVL